MQHAISCPHYWIHVKKIPTVEQQTIKVTMVTHQVNEADQALYMHHSTCTVQYILDYMNP